MTEATLFSGYLASFDNKEVVGKLESNEQAGLSED